MTSIELPRLEIRRDTKKDVVLAAALALGLALIGYAINGNAAMHLQDEGFLWYGVVHTAQGEVPLRDFRSYDPARYYWCAAWAQIFGDGFLALRLSCALFQVIGLTFGLLAARRAVRSSWMLVPIGVILWVWFFPPEKPFEASAAMASVFAAVKLIEKPNLARHLVTGIVVGVAGFFGRNLGLYAGLGLLAVIAFLRFKLPRSSRNDSIEATSNDTRAPGAKALGAWMLGVVVGYSPMLVMIVFVPGFRESFVESVLFYTRQTALNAPLPAPWPWTIEFAHASLWQGSTALSLSLCFLLLPVFFLAGLAALLRMRVDEIGRKALFVAAVLVGAIFTHQASVRSDVNHLAQCIHPMLLGCIAIPLLLPPGSDRWRVRCSIASVAVLFVLSALAIAPRQPYGHRLGARNRPNPFVPFDARGDTVWIDRGKANFLTALTATIRSHVKPDEKLWLAPRMLTLYPLLGRKSPVWDIYPAWNAGPEEESRMLAEIASVQWVIWMDQPTEDDDALRLANSHPAVWKKLMEDFDRLTLPELPISFFVLHRKHP